MILKCDRCLRNLMLTDPGEQKTISCACKSQIKEYWRRNKLADPGNLGFSVVMISGAWKYLFDLYKTPS
jgi:hypothetical protein